MQRKINSLALISLFLLSFLASCTYSVTLVHTEGEASDVVDENQAPAPTATVTVPASLVGP